MMERFEFSFPKTKQRQPKNCRKLFTWERNVLITPSVGSNKSKKNKSKCICFYQVTPTFEYFFSMLFRFQFHFFKENLLLNFPESILELNFPFFSLTLFKIFALSLPFILICYFGKHSLWDLCHMFYFVFTCSMTPNWFKSFLHFRIERERKEKTFPQPALPISSSLK